MPEVTVQLLLEFLADLKAEDVINLDVTSLTTITDTMIICCGRSSRHVKAIAERLITDAKILQLEVLRASGLEQSEWIILDFGNILLHIFQPAIREFYNLEELWHAWDEQGQDHAS